MKVIKESLKPQKPLLEGIDNEVPYFKAFITNLGKYNEGELVGEWVDFPIDEDDFNEVLERIEISDEPNEDGDIYEEWFVTDYDCNLNGFNWQNLGEYPSYEKLQEFGELVESIDDVEAVDNAYEVTNDLEEAIEGLANGDIYYYPEIANEYDLGYMVVEDMFGGVDQLDPTLVEIYFDYEALGRDLGFDEYETDEEDEDGNPIYVSAGEYWCGNENASDYEIGEAAVDNVGFAGLVDASNYFDYDAFGDSLTMENFTLTKDGAIEYI